MSEQIATGAPGTLRAGDAQSRIILAGAIGNLVEWYDWTVYGLLVGVFSPAIFPRGNALVRE
jgi:MHS family proline/betaine transporter-like MFS transporter